MEVSKVFQTIKNEGRLEGRIEDARKMLSRGMNKDLIHDITELPMDKIDQIERKMKHP